MSDAFYLGRKINEKKFVEGKSRVLQPDEELQCVIKGKLTRGVRRRGEKGDYTPIILFVTIIWSI